MFGIGRNLTPTASRPTVAFAFTLKSNPIRCNVKDCNPIQHKHAIQCNPNVAQFSSIHVEK